MSNQGERDLISLVRSEQRGFRFIMFAGLALLFVLAIMSAALGFYYWRASQQLETMISRQDFDARRKFDQQSTTVAAQGRRLDRFYAEIRRFAGANIANSSDAAALVAADAYLLRGHRLSLAEENALDTAAQRAGNSAQGAFIAAVAQLNAWRQRNNDAIPLGTAELPAELVSVRAAFDAARQADPGFAQRASAGMASVLNLEAAGPYSNYKPEHCAALFAAVAGAPPASPQPLWWQAQCERKLGRTSDALRDYARVLATTWQNSATTADDGEIFLAMNAFHGVGTTLIVLNNAGDPAVAEALPLARQACAPEGEELMQLAISCLHRAVALRQRLRQTPNEVSGTAENLGFAYLRTGDFDGAFRNAEAVERTGLFAWNELLRALSAAHLSSEAARLSGAEARRNVRFFNIEQFNPCEIRVLLNDDHFAEAVALISAGRPRRERNSVAEAVAACAG